jgi:hypothetical protein
VRSHAGHMLRVLPLTLAYGLLLLLPLPAPAAPDLEVLTNSANEVDGIAVAGGKNEASVVVDSQDYPVVQLAAQFFADDIQRVTGRRPGVTNAPGGASQVILVGTLDHSALIQQLASGGKLKNLDQVRGKWEATLFEIVAKPFPDVDRALVIVGSDRRGAAYGLMRLSQKVGVSPWHWWADVPVQHRDALTLKLPSPLVDAPGVRYRGIFINDEDWGIHPWASRTFDPDSGNIGPRTYEKVFELMLRLRLNYLWPAMHGVSTEFGSVPDNYKLADKFGIVMGSSHCEPMLFNNVHWNEREKGRWNYSQNRDAIHSTWEQTVRARGEGEAVWTLGVRGIHDAGMETPPSDMPGKLSLMGQVFADQRDLLSQYATKVWGPVAQCFVPYKEVLPIYDAGLKVPDDVTLVWVDDNFGYIRRLSTPSERSRAGGAGVYWHISYYGSPHSYTWINTTAPALMWEELHKAWDNNARAIWVVNVGDIKPMEIGIDYLARLAWSPDAFPLGAQRQFLRDFAAENFGERLADSVGELLMDFYRLGTVRKPELMNREWALSLAREQATQLEGEYQKLLSREESLARVVPAAARDAYTELIGFPVQVVGESGRIFMADRNVQLGRDAAANEREVTRLREALESQVQHYNTNVAGGKWNRMMPGLVTGRNLTAWNSQVRWPWGERQTTNPPVVVRAAATERDWRDASTANRRSNAASASWVAIEGLGPSGSAVALQPVSLAASWNENDSNAPSLEFDFEHNGGDGEAWLNFLPTFRICPGMRLRIAVSVDAGGSTVLEVPGSSGAENENGTVRSAGVQNNYVQARMPLQALSAGKHKFTIHAMDPGVVLDRVSLP